MKTVFEKINEFEARGQGLIQFLPLGMGNGALANFSRRFYSKDKSYRDDLGFRYSLFTFLKVLCLVTIVCFSIHVYSEWNERLWGVSIPPPVPGGVWGWEEERFGFEQATRLLPPYVAAFILLFGVAYFVGVGLDKKSQKIVATYSDQINQMKNSVDAASTRLENSLKIGLIVDSNIWMDMEYEWLLALFLRLSKNSPKYLLPGIQFDEMCNLKKGSKYGDQASSVSRLAINRIEQLQKSDNCRITSIKINSQRGAYADPLLIQLLCISVKAHGAAVLLTNDKELRIRARQIVSNLGHSDKVVITTPVEFFYPDASLFDQLLD